MIVIENENIDTPPVSGFRIPPLSTQGRRRDMEDIRAACTFALHIELGLLFPYSSLQINGDLRR